jgi:hypothetical protein
VAVGVALSLALVAAYAVRGQFASTNHSAPAANARATARSIAVVPFIDLTEGMSHEYFADGMTEEVIDKLSKAPGIRVAAPYVVVLLEGQANRDRRYRENARCRICTGWERAQVRRYTAGRRPPESWRQWVCCLVRDLRPAIGRHIDGPGRHRRRGDESAEGVHR